ncbi:hypothetical protein [Haloferula helveola]
MRRSLLWISMVTPTLVSGDLFPGSPGGPELLTPGSATWQSTTTPLGERTVYTLTGDTVLSWGSLRVGAGDELIFEGSSGVVNLLSAGGTHRIDGSVSAEGAIGFFADGGSLQVDGLVEGASVTLSALKLESAGDYFSGGAYALDGGAGGSRRLTVDGQVRATGGDVVMAGEIVRIRGGATIDASQAVRVGGGSRVDVADSGQKRLSSMGTGLVLHLGTSRAATLELVGVQQVANAGRLETPGASGKIFLEVGPGGTVLNEGTGVIQGILQVTGDFDNDGVILGGDDGDQIGVVNSSLSRLPEVRRPDGSVASKARELSVEAPMTASADSGRDRAKRRTVASRQKPKLLTRQSFFGMRGGSTAQPSRDKKRER